MPLYDVIYSITVHESPRVVQDLIKNILYYNSLLRIGIILNACPTIYEAVTTLATDNVYVVCSPNIRKLGTLDIVMAHILTYEYCVKHDIVAEYFVLLASNCMFWKDTTREMFLKSTPVCDISIPKRHSGWAWPSIYANTDIISILEEAGIRNLQAQYHEGGVFEYVIFDKISKFIRENNIEQKMQRLIVFEEFLLQSLYTHFTGKQNNNVCKIFWHSPSYVPTIDDVLRCDQPCVKRVLRDYDNPLRKWLRERANNYIRE